MVSSCFRRKQQENAPIEGCSEGHCNGGILGYLLPGDVSQRRSSILRPVLEDLQFPGPAPYCKPYTLNPEKRCFRRPTRGCPQAEDSSLRSFPRQVWECGGGVRECGKLHRVAITAITKLKSAIEQNEVSHSQLSCSIVQTTQLSVLGTSEGSLQRLRE